MMSWDVFCSFVCRGAASLIVSVGLSLVIFRLDAYHLDGRDVKWVLLRGLASASSYISTVCAVQLDVGNIPIYSMWLGRQGLQGRTWVPSGLSAV